MPDSTAHKAMGHVADHDTFRHSYSRDKSQLVRRLSRLEGQVRGIARMVEREEYCVDILQQTAALRAANRTRADRPAWAAFRVARATDGPSRSRPSTVTFG